jgi:O-succinylbenzoic acid--CoA ligase
MTGPSEQFLPEWLSMRAADRPQALAVIDGDTRWTYAQLDRIASTVACRLGAVGVGPGDRVAALLSNGSGYVALVHGLIRLGAVLVPLNLRLAPPELARQIAFARARLLVYDQWTESQARSLSPHGAIPPLLAIGDALMPLPRPRKMLDPLPRLNLTDPHCVVFTSGTTGQAKGVLLTYGNHWWSALGSAMNLGLHADDRWLVCLPLFHVGGMAILIRAVIYGIPVVFPPSEPGGRGFEPNAIHRAMVEEHVTLVSIVTVMLQRLLDYWATGSAPPSLRCALLGGGPAPRAVLADCVARNLPVVQSYGMTETASQVAALSPVDALRKLGSAGRPLLTNEIRVVPLASAGETGQAESDIEGEIWVRGPSVTPGYLQEGEEPDMPHPAVDQEGWLHTGDIGRLDREGYLYVLDRRADLIISGGENVSPAEVEAVLLTHNDILEAAVYGAEDPVWGQKVVAALVLRPGAVLDDDGLLEFCRRKLAGYKIPRQVRIVGVLPRNAAGKLLRRQLRDETDPPALDANP